MEDDDIISMPNPSNYLKFESTIQKQRYSWLTNSIKSETTARIKIS